jgi:L-alanine-DL-glutamate epimerase-like enolase superfamily enzyme
MRLKDVKVHIVSVPLKEAIHWTWQIIPITAFDFVVVEVRDEEGNAGYSALYDGVSSKELLMKYKMFIEGIVKWALTSVEFESRDLHRIASICTHHYMRIGFLEAAVWDLMARREGKPLCKLLGGCRKRVKVYASMGRLVDVDMAKRHIDWYLKQGIDIVKVRFHRPDPMEDVKVLKELKKIYGSSVRFAVDANQALAVFPPFWDRWTALRVAEELYQLEVLWLEEPLYREDVEGYVWLRSKSRVAIAGGEAEYGLSNVLRRIDVGMYDIVQYDATLDNGVYEALTIANYTALKGLKYLAHAWNPGLGWLINLHITASLPEHLSPYIETPLDPSWFWEEVMFAVCDKEPPKIVEGYVEIGDEPGTGYSISSEKIKKFSIS